MACDKCPICGGELTIENGYIAKFEVVIEYCENCDYVEVISIE